MFYLKCLGLSLALLLLGCAGQQRLFGSSPVVIDTQGVNRPQYEQDLSQCREYAEEISLARKTATGAAAGAAVGGLIGAAVGNSDTAKRGAGVGAITGGAGGALDAHQEKTQIVKNCLRGRGYRVLN